MTAAPTAATARAIASLRIGLFTESSLLPTSPDAGIAVTGRFDDEDRPGLVRTGSPVGPDVEGVAKPVSEQVEGQGREHQEEAREEHQPPGHVVVRLGVVEEAAPRGGVPVHAEAEVGQGRLEEDV